MGTLTDQILLLGYVYLRIGTKEYAEARKLESVGAVTVQHYSGKLWVARLTRGTK